MRKGRIRRLIDQQLPISLACNLRLVGRDEPVLVERVARKPASCLVGRTDGNKLVVFAGDASVVGSRRTVRLTGADGLMLFGELAAQADRPELGSR